MSTLWVGEKEGQESQGRRAVLMALEVLLTPSSAWPKWAGQHLWISWRNSLLLPPKPKFLNFNHFKGSISLKYIRLTHKQSRASLVAQLVKNPPAVQETQVQSLVGKILWKREWLPTSVFLPGEFHCQRSLVGDSPWGHRVRHDVVTKSPHKQSAFL